MFKDVMKAGTASLAALTLQAAAALKMQNSIIGQLGTGRAGQNKRRVAGSTGEQSTTFVRVTRQMERADARAEGKQLDSRMKRRRRDDAARSLSQRASERELREVHRKDARFTVHDMIEQSRGRSRFSRRVLA
jgi:hypothetical protein